MAGLRNYCYDPREFLSNGPLFSFVADLGSRMNLGHDALVWKAEGDE